MLSCFGGGILPPPPPLLPFPLLLSGAAKCLMLSFIDASCSAWRLLLLLFLLLFAIFRHCYCKPIQTRHSLSHRLLIELATFLCEHVPLALSVCVCFVFVEDHCFPPSLVLQKAKVGRNFCSSSLLKSGDSGTDTVRPTLLWEEQSRLPQKRQI